jgi:hypothetical protein
LRAEDQYHVGIVVPDLDVAKKEWAAVAHYSWGTEMSAMTNVLLPIGTIPLPMRLVYSTSLPRIELVQEIPGTIWEPVPQSGIHHLGFWSDDVAGDGTDLKVRGYREEASGLNDDGDILWSFHRNDEGGARIELVSRTLEAMMAPLWSVTD